MNGGVFSYGIPGNWIGRQPENGGNAVEPMHDVAPCLTKADRHGVAHPISWDEELNARVDLAGMILRGGAGGRRDGVAQPITFGAQMSVPQTDVDMVQTLQAKNPMAVMQPMAFDLAQITSSTNRSRVEPGLPSGTLSKHSQMNLATSMAVRRLTPQECERLQGFPDFYTAIPWRNKAASDCPDGPRYKALGNSMAVPVMRWIGERIQMVDKVIRQKEDRDVV